MGDLGYPTETIAEAWYVHPSEHWSGEQWRVTRELNHIPSYKPENGFLIRNDGFLDRCSANTFLKIG